MDYMVSIVIPCRNEEKFIGKCLDSIIAQDYPKDKLEVLVVDGLSEDGTRDILKKYEEKYSQVRILTNAQKTVPFALKLLLAEAGGDFIIRADAHCIYPPDYVATLVKYLIETGADNVGGVINTLPGDDSVNARIIASCLNSKFGVGVSFRTLSGEKPVEVESVPFGAWRSDYFEKYGTFNEKFIRGQDLEHNIRVKKMGGRILCLPWLKVTYYARGTFLKLRKMSFQYGYWKNIVRLKHKTKVSVRQHFPPLLVLGTSISIPLGIFISSLFFLIPVFYLLVNFMAALERGWVVKKNNLLLYMYGFFVMHYYYGFGYLRALWDFYVIKGFGFHEITR